MKATILHLFLIFLLLNYNFITGHAQAGNHIRIIMIGAHPDDCDLDGGGTAILFSKMGHAVKFLSLTNGDAGHQTMKGEALAKRRLAEAQEAGKRFGVTYDVLDNHDGQLMPDLEVRLQVIKKIREWDADLVIAPRHIAIDITSVFDQKVHSVDAHTSQMYEWLPWIGHYLDQVPKNNEGRRIWLSKIITVEITPDVRSSLVNWYGKERANTIRYAEAFEICEYGAQPNDNEKKRLFPMLGIK